MSTNKRSVGKNATAKTIHTECQEGGAERRCGRRPHHSGEHTTQDAGAGGAGASEASGGRWAREWGLGPELNQGFPGSFCDIKLATKFTDKNCIDKKRTQNP